MEYKRAMANVVSDNVLLMLYQADVFSMNYRSIKLFE